MLKMKKLMGDQLKFQQLSVQKEIESELIQKLEKKEIKEQKKVKVEDSKEDVHSEPDEVMTISRKKKDKKRPKPAEPVKEAHDPKRVRFDLSQNKITEFFKHGKVAQRTFEL